MNDLSHLFTKYSLHYAAYYICRKIDSSMRLNILYIGGWRSLFSKKMVSVASFSLKSAATSSIYYLVTLLPFTGGCSDISDMVWILEEK